MTAPEPLRRPGRLKMIEARPQILGHVVIGEAGEKHPRKFDHLEIRRPSRDGHDRLELDLPLTMALASRESAAGCGGCSRCEEIEKQYGVKLPNGLPRRVGIYLPSDDLEVVFPTGLAFYRGRRRFCYGDGETALRYAELTPRDGRPAFGALQPHKPCGATCPDFQARRCRPSAHMNFVLAGQHVAGGFYQFRTSSWASIRAIEAGLAQIQEVAGSFRFVGLVFEVVQQRVQPADGSAAGKAWIARVYYPGSYAQLAAEARQELSAVAPQRTAVRALEAELRNDLAHPPLAAQGTFEGEFRPVPEEDLSQEAFDPETGEVFEDVPTIDRGGEATGAPAAELSHPGPVSAGEESDGPFGATAAELEAEAERVAAQGISEAQVAHLVEALERAGISPQSKRINFIRGVTRRNVKDLSEVRGDEYAQACLELGVRPVGEQAS